jgi:hypothetical protein
MILKSSMAYNPTRKVRCEALQMRMSSPELVWPAKQRVECSRWAGCACTGCREVIVGHHSPSSRLSSSDRVATIVALSTTSPSADLWSFDPAWGNCF